MNEPQLRAPKNWSFSSWSLYDQCPFKFKQIRVLKKEEPPNPAFEYGLKVHKALEDFLNLDSDEIPSFLDHFFVEIQNLRKRGAEAEEQWTIDENWKAIHSEKAWFSKEAWLRAKIDARVDNIIIDLKTGKHYTKYNEQAELYALCFFLFHGDEVCDVEFWYSKSGSVVSYQFFRSDMERIMDKWTKRANEMISDTEWEPKVNEYCKYCHFKKECPAWQN